MAEITAFLGVYYMAASRAVGALQTTLEHERSMPALGVITPALNSQFL